MPSDMNNPQARPEPTLLPPVDIVPDASTIILYADMPGVDNKDLAVGVDGRTLIIEGPVTLGEANALVSVYAEVRSNRYRRSFDLSSELDTGAIEASLKDGVLMVRIPKSEQAKPRRIEVRT